MGANLSDFPYEDPGPAVTNERISRIIKKVESTDNVVVESVQEQSGDEVGEGLASNMGVVEVQAVVGDWEDRKTYNWVLKSIPRDIGRFHRSRHVFSYNEREVRFFRDLLPRLKEFANGKDGGFSVPSFTDVPFADWTEDDKVLVMQNLKKNGYKDGLGMIVDGIDLDHTEMAIKWLAKFHALGYAYFQQTFCECRNWRCQGTGVCDCGIKNLKKSDLNIFLMNFCDIPNFDGIQNGYSAISEENFFPCVEEFVIYQQRNFGRKLVFGNSLPDHKHNYSEIP